ncbi:hypothetical protein ABEF93_005575 [Exophiala dermatitidis]
MRGIKQLFSPLLCCFGLRNPEEPPASDLRNLKHPASVLSVQLPATTVPHAPGPSPSNVADKDALRQIFRSSPSVRGYRTASQSSALPVKRQYSLDVDFKFGPTAPEQKQPGRLEQLGSHIRQKLSESRLSRSSSKQHVSGETARESSGMSLQPLGMGIPEAGVSQRSTGLLELLMSRAGSEAGYDSDARSIHTAMLTDGDAAVKPSSQSPAKIEISCDDSGLAAGIAAAVAQGEQGEELATDPADTNRTTDPSSSKPSFVGIVMEEYKRSPTKTLQRLSEGLATGTIKLPDAPDLLDGSQKCTEEKMDDLPKRDSQQHDTELRKALRRLAATVRKAESLTTHDGNFCDGLLPNLNRSLICFISKFGEHDLEDSIERTSCKEGRVGHDRVPRQVGKAEQGSANASIAPDQGGLKRDMPSLADSDRSSVHLYNMRISQQLASPSITADGSRPETSRTSIEQYKIESADAGPAISRLSLSERHPSWIATEHNRRPSDPRTRRLFENGISTDKASSQLKSVLSAGASACYEPVKGAVTRDDASSFYWSDGEVSSGNRRTPSNPRRNPNSIAVAGRSDSMSLPARSSGGSIAHASVAAENAWFGRNSSQLQRQGEGNDRLQASTQRHRSASMPTGDRSRPSTSIPIRRKLQLHSTEDDEALSEISAEQLQDARRERLTELSVQAVHDSYNERMSDVGPAILSSKGNEKPAWLELDPFWSTERRPRTSSDPFPNNGRRRTISGSGRTPLKGSEISSQETTTDMWRRTLKRAMEEPNETSLGGFLTAPKFDREGRRRSSTSSHHSATACDRDTTTAEQMNVPDNRILHVDRMYPASAGEEKTEDSSGQPRGVGLKRSIPKLTIGRPVKKKSSEKAVLKKRSILDLGKRFTIVSGTRQDERRHGAGTQFRDLLGIWGRFPSHSRDVRSGSAGERDGVAVRDFALECVDENAVQAIWNRSTLTLSLPAPPSWRRLPFGRKGRIDKGKSKSLDLLRSSVNEPQFLSHGTRKGGKGFVGRWKKIYRSSSSELRAYMQTYGHRSSISMSGSVEYPELEIIPGHDGSHDSRPLRSGLQGNQAATRELQRGRLVGKQSFTGTRGDEPRENTVAWKNMYRDCVGSLSALKSDVDLQQVKHIDGEREHQGHDKQSIGGTQSADLRSSTVDFEVQLGRQHDSVREGLIRKIEDMGRESSDGILAKSKQGKHVKQD